MLTNIYTPCVGGITRSIEAFRREFLRRGHEVLVVAPEFPGRPTVEEGVIRCPAIPRVYRNRYSLPLPLPGYLQPALQDFSPDVIHSHHPFLLGSTAQRISAVWQVPLVYTHHTRYRLYMETSPKPLVELVWSLTVAYCELCDALIAPSNSIREMLEEAGIDRPIEVVPTGLDFERFRRGDGRRARAAAQVPAEAPLVGYVGRLEPEKNPGFLARAVAGYLEQNPDAHFLLVGEGLSRAEIEAVFGKRGVADRLHATGLLEGQDLVDAYHALDVFAFASHTETQGMVLGEAMAAGVPVVALEASGVRDLLVDGHNGRMLEAESESQFVAALNEVTRLPSARRRAMREAARQTARDMSIARCAERALAIYDRLAQARPVPAEGTPEAVARPMRLLDYEWKAWSKIVEAMSQAIFPGDSSPPRAH